MKKTLLFMLMVGLLPLLTGCEEIENNVLEEKEQIQEKEISVIETETPANLSTNTEKTMKSYSITDGLMAEITVEGNGTVAKKGDNVIVHYTGTLTDGSKFDSSKDHGKPFNFSLGGGQVIKGWDLGVVGMKIGETRKLIIAPELAYGDGGFPPVIPPKSTLFFEIELLEIR